MANKVNKAEFDAMIGSGEVVIVDFFATWCGPCQMFMPIFDEVATKESVKMVKVDIDEETELAGANGVMGVPTIIAYKGGQEVSRFAGFKPADELENFINSVK